MVIIDAVPDNINDGTNTVGSVISPNPTVKFLLSITTCPPTYIPAGWANNLYKSIQSVVDKPIFISKPQNWYILSSVIYFPDSGPILSPTFITRFLP